MLIGLECSVGGGSSGEHRSEGGVQACFNFRIGRCDYYLMNHLQIQIYFDLYRKYPFDGVTQWSWSGMQSGGRGGRLGSRSGVCVGCLGRWCRPIGPRGGVFSGEFGREGGVQAFFVGSNRLLEDLFGYGRLSEQPGLGGSLLRTMA